MWLTSCDTMYNCVHMCMCVHMYVHDCGARAEVPIMFIGDGGASLHFCVHGFGVEGGMHAE